MKELVIISGKGGTGKTSVTASLAHLAGSVVLADCDVDAADLHLVAGAVIEETTPFISGHLAQVDSESCVSCGVCEPLCRFDAISLSQDSQGKARVDPHLCQGCRVCVHNCPVQAIEFIPRLCGDSFVSRSRLGLLSHARLLPGADNSGKLVSLVRQKAKALAQENQAEWLLVDGPPGIACPVIASITGADAVLLVSEPSLSALHDLKRVVQLCRHFSLPAYCVLNRFDIHPVIAGELEAEMLRMGVPIVGRIPYDPAFTKAQVAGISLVELAADSPAALAIRDAWQTLGRELNDK